ncbi:MAG: M14 family zinc carboxypeptidase [Thermoplasmatota archaeon]
MKWTVLLCALLLAPAALADHPGVEQGLVMQEPLVANLVHRLPDVQNTFADWESQHPGLVERMQIGASTLGLPLETIRLTDETVTKDKTRVYLDGGHHGNEYLGVELVMYYLESLLEDPGFLATHEVYATPMINPEGNTLDTRKNGNQVDVNRNYGFMWGGGGSSDLLLDFNYRGEAPFSEPEVLANAEFGRDIHPDLWITMHTGVAEFYWPWGWTQNPAPDAAFFESLEEPFESATNGNVQAMQSAELYIAAGATDDWAYAELGIPAFTYEVHEDQFVPIYGQAVSSLIQDQLNGLDLLVKNAAKIGGLADLHVIGGDFHVYNAGWGPMYNVTVRAGEETLFLPALGADEMYEFDGLPAENITVTYQSLAIETAPMRTASFTADSIEPSAESEESPGFAVLFAVVALALLTRRLQ